MKKSLPILQLLSLEFIYKHSIPSNIVYGKAICNRGAVKIIEFGGDRVKAWVGGLDGKVVKGGGSKRKVEFIASKNRLQWSCAGNPKDHQIFCKHCVALALELLKN